MALIAGSWRRDGRDWNIYGTGQVDPNNTILTFVGSTSASANLTAFGVNLVDYIGAGNLVSEQPDRASFMAAGRSITGRRLRRRWWRSGSTASVTYEYAPVPEPGTFALMVCGLAGLLVMRRRSA